MDLILKGVNSNLTKEEILEKVEITDSELKRLLDLGGDGVKGYITFYEIFKRDYLIKRKNQLLFYLSDNSLDYSLKNAYISPNEFKKWISKVEKHFALNRQDALSKFYIKTTEKLMNLYLKYRKDGVSKSDSAKRINVSTKTVDKWMRSTDHEIFTNFPIKLVEDGENAKTIANQTKTSIDEVFEWHIKRWEGDEHFEEFSEIFGLQHLEMTMENFQEFFDEEMGEEFFLSNVVKKQIHPEYLFLKKSCLINPNTGNKVLKKSDEIAIYKKLVLDKVDFNERLNLINNDEIIVNDCDDESIILDEDVKDKIIEIVGFDDKRIDEILKRDED